MLPAQMYSVSFGFRQANGCSLSAPRWFLSYSHLLPAQRKNTSILISLTSVFTRTSLMGNRSGALLMCSTHIRLWTGFYKLIRLHLTHEFDQTVHRVRARICCQISSFQMCMCLVLPLQPYLKAGFTEIREKEMNTASVRYQCCNLIFTINYHLLQHKFKCRSSDSCFCSHLNGQKTVSLDSMLPLDGPHVHYLFMKRVRPCSGPSFGHLSLRAFFCEIRHSRLSWHSLRTLWSLRGSLKNVLTENCANLENKQVHREPTAHGAHLALFSSSQNTCFFFLCSFAFFVCMFLFFTQKGGKAQHLEMSSNQSPRCVGFNCLALHHCAESLLGIKRQRNRFPNTS